MKNENLGKTARVKSTGVEGVVVGYAQYLNDEHPDLCFVLPEDRDVDTVDWVEINDVEFLGTP